MKVLKFARKNIALFAVLLLAVTITPSAQADETAPGAGVGAHPVYGGQEDWSAGLDEINKSWGDDLMKDCSDCTFNETTHKTSCTYAGYKGHDPKHHLTRCEVIKWSENTSGLREYSKCDSYFVGADGHMSEAGKTIMKEIARTVQQEGSTANFIQDNDCLSSQLVEGLGTMPICPNFNKFDPVKRMQFYEYLMENIAFRENSCNAKPKMTRGSNDKAVCAFQLEYDEKFRDSRGLSNCSGPPSKVVNPDGCAVCATDIMEHSLGTLKNPDHGTCAPFGRMLDGDMRKMYWQSLNPPGPGQPHVHRRLLNDLHWFPGCQDNPQPWPEDPYKPPVRHKGKKGKKKKAQR